MGLEIRAQVDIAQSSPESLYITLVMDSASSDVVRVDNLLCRHNVYAVEFDASRLDTNNLV